MKLCIFLLFLSHIVSEAHLRSWTPQFERARSTYEHDELAAELEAAETDLSSLLSSLRTELAQERSAAQELKVSVNTLKAERDQAQIQNAALQAKLASASQPQPKQPKACSDTSIVPAAPLSRGARGPAVAQLQDILIAAGLMN